MLSEIAQSSGTPALRALMAARASNSNEEKGLPGPGGDSPGEKKKLGGLVLTRHLGESIMIGEEVEVQVVGLKAGTVRLKIVAPRTIAVHRREVYDEIQVNPAPPKEKPSTAPSAEAAAPRPSKPLGGLVLTRYAQQSIMIGDEVEIAVVDVRPTTVKLKISAPRTIAVHRREVYEAIRGQEG